MEKRNIVVSCDTTIALSNDEIKELNLNVIPLNAIADGVEYHDTVDIDVNKLCALMENGAKVSTSTPTIGEIEAYFDDLFEKTNADVIIHYTISSKLSSMFSLFTTVCKEKYGDKVIVVDSYSICCWMLRQVLYTRHLVETTTLSAQEIIAKVKEELHNEGKIIFVPGSLEYLKRGGRISGAVAAIANFIGVLPVLTFGDGEVGKKGVTRTVQKACYTALLEWRQEIKNFDEDYEILIITSDDKMLEKAHKVVGYLESVLGEFKYSFAKISLNVAAHAGPGTMGIGFAKKVKM